MIRSRALLDQFQGADKGDVFNKLAECEPDKINALICSRALLDKFQGADKKLVFNKLAECEPEKIKVLRSINGQLSLDRLKKSVQIDSATLAKFGSFEEMAKYEYLLERVVPLIPSDKQRNVIDCIVSRFKNNEFERLQKLVEAEKTVFDKHQTEKNLVVFNIVYKYGVSKNYNPLELKDIELLTNFAELIEANIDEKDNKRIAFAALAKDPELEYLIEKLEKCQTNEDKTKFFKETLLPKFKQEKISVFNSLITELQKPEKDKEAREMLLKCVQDCSMDDWADMKLGNKMVRDRIVNCAKFALNLEPKDQQEILKKLLLDQSQFGIFSSNQDQIKEIIKNPVNYSWVLDLPKEVDYSRLFKMTYKFPDTKEIITELGNDVERINALAYVANCCDKGVSLEKLNTLSTTTLTNLKKLPNVKPKLDNILQLQSKSQEEFLQEVGMPKDLINQPVQRRKSSIISELPEHDQKEVHIIQKHISQIINSDSKNPTITNHIKDIQENKMGI